MVIVCFSLMVYTCFTLGIYTCFTLGIYTCFLPDQRQTSVLAFLCYFYYSINQTFTMDLEFISRFAC